MNGSLGLSDTHSRYFDHKGGKALISPKSIEVNALNWSVNRTGTILKVQTVSKLVVLID